MNAKSIRSMGPVSHLIRIRLPSISNTLILALQYANYRALQAESTSATNESILKVALDHGKVSGLIKVHDRVVICQKVGDASVVKIIELED